MNLDGQGHESHNQDPPTISLDSHGHTHGHGRTSHQDHEEKKDPRHSFVSDIKSIGSFSDDNDDASSKGSFKSRQSQHQDKHARLSSDENRESRNSHPINEHHPHHLSHVHFKERASAVQSATHLPPLAPTGKPKSHSHSSEEEKPQEDLARASWTTASFTEVPNALDELTHQHHPSKTSAKDPHELEHTHHPPPSPEPENQQKKPSLERNSATDLHSILAKQSQQGQGSILTKYLRPTMSDEGTQAGIPSWDWLTRLEQMLIHFFLMVFEASNDSSKLIMEMMSTEAGAQIEEIFQLLLKAEPDMYKELGHLVALAEKWLIHWRGDSEERQKALDYVRLYMQGVKDKNYYDLPIQVRLHKLGAFIAGLKVMGKGQDGSGAYPPIRFPSYKAHRVQSGPVNQLRVGSPRVKPATHFSQVVANILCGRPCDDPLPKADVYADNLGRNLFKNTLHGDKEFKTYTDKKYGNLYMKKELFAKEYARQDSLEIEGSGDAEGKILGRADCVENLHCWIPKYTKSYVQTLKDDGCEILAKADYERSTKVKECRLGKGNAETCKGIAKTIKQPKKLYEWVRGPDGKVHRRAVGSYTELGTTASMSKITGTGDDATVGGGRKGPGGILRHGKKGMKGGPGGGYASFPKAVSDTRLGRKSYETRKSQTTRASKARYTNTSKDRLGKDDKGKKTVAGTMDNSIYKMDRVSTDGSGDSGQENTIRAGKSKRGVGASDDKNAKKGIQSQKGKGENNKFGANYHGPSHYKPKSRGAGGDQTKERAARGVRGSGAAAGEFQDKGFVNVFDKKNRRAQQQQHGQNKYNKSYKSRFRMRPDEWGGEADWSPRGSDYFNYLEKDEAYKQENLQLLSLNQCWEKASKLFKKPSKALVIPPAENIMLHLEKKYSKSRWARGDPIATRNYPNGSIFVAQYGNGSSKVYYPHGGLAVAISAPSPVTSQVLIVRDPSDHVFFFDKALLAELNSGGKGIIYAEDGVIKAQYSAIGGFKLDNLEKGRRWHWNQGGQRMLIKLNKYMSLRMSDQDKIFLNFFGNHRGFLVNVASGHEVILMNPTSRTTRVDPIMHELKNLIRPKTQDDNFDYIRGKFDIRPTLGFVDKAKHYVNADRNLIEMMESDKQLEENRAYSTEERYQNDIYDPFSRKYEGCRDFLSYTNDFPNCTNLNSITLNTFPIATYNTIC